MRIGEVAERTGLSISNIRFYEKKGLIGPNRDEESKYRNYTEEDLDVLNQIILYRKMDISVETIGNILEGNCGIEQTLRQQIEELEGKKQELQASIDLCEKIISDNAYDDMDVDYYLSYVKDEEAKGRVYGKLEEIVDDILDYTQFDNTMYKYSLGGILALKPGLRKVAIFSWIMLTVVAPITLIIWSIIYRKENNLVALCLDITMLVCMAYSFHVYKMKKRLRLGASYAGEGNADNDGNN